MAIMSSIPEYFKAHHALSGRKNVKSYHGNSTFCGTAFCTSTVHRCRGISARHRKRKERKVSE